VDSLSDVSGHQTVSGSARPRTDRFDFVIRVATGEVPDLDKISEQLRTWSYQEAEPLDPAEHAE